MKEIPSPRIGILVVAYNAESTLEKTLDRIPEDFRSRIAEILILDDASSDGTFIAGCRWSQLDGTPPTVVMRHTKNLGYGGNQKAGYALAAERGLDIVVLLHGDGQYAPELLPEMVAPIERGECEAVFGSRMMRSGSALKGGMPFYKWLGNRLLTRLENGLLGSRLTEFHSGYRAYSVAALRRLPIDRNTDAFDFDTQIIVQLLDAGMRIKEIPAPTYYGDEICYVNGLRYAKDVVKDVLEYRLALKGFGTCPWIPKPVDYAFKEGDGSSHSAILKIMRGLPPGRVLDVGCSGGLFAERLEDLGHTVTGLDFVEVPGVRDRCSAFLLADLEKGLPPQVRAGYDYVVAGDVIEHLSRPEHVLRELREVLRPGGRMLLSVPNFSHWYSRLRVAFGAFGYDRRGILDETHLRFFTRSSLRRTVRAAGFDQLRITATGAPFWSVLGGGALARALGGISRLMTRVRPTLFAYQYVAVLTPHAAQTIVAGEHVDVQDILSRQYVPAELAGRVGAGT